MTQKQISTSYVFQLPRLVQGQTNPEAFIAIKSALAIEQKPWP